jgi:hypothetical protein
MKSAEASGSVDGEQIVQLIKDQNTLLIQEQIKKRGGSLSLDAQTLLDVFERVNTEMTCGMQLDSESDLRPLEEQKSSTLYGDLRDKLPDYVKLKAPVPLSPSASYPENPRSVVLLIKIMLTDVTIVAAITAPTSAPSA